MDSSEVLIAVSNNCFVYNINNGNIMASFNNANIAPKTLALIGEDYIIGAVAGQPRMKMWTLSKLKNQSVTYTCKGIVHALAVTNCGTYCVGAIEKELHIWQTHCGELLNVLSLYGKATCLKFSSDGSHLVCGGEDGSVLVWLLSQMIGIHIDRDQVRPRFVWSDHTNEITDIYTGLLGPLSRILTVSLDSTCKIYELDTGMLLTTIFVDVPLLSVVSDALEYHVFLGAKNGTVYKINTYERLPREIHFDEREQAQFKAHDHGVFSLTLSVDGTKLLSASDDGICRLWDIESMACLLQIPHDGKLTNAFLAVKPKALGTEYVQPQFFVSQFQKNFEIPNLNKLYRSKLLSKPLSLMNFGSNDRLYSTDILCASAPVSENISDLDRKYESICQESLHGGMVTELKTVNHQIYSYMINHGFDNLTFMKSD